jgi:V/A-type H+-transporting ATPase subunit A
MLDLIKQGDAIAHMMQVTGEEGITLEDWVTYQKSWLLDTVFLQQDAFDPVDVSSPLERQKELFDLILCVVSSNYRLPDRDAARSFFTRMAGLFKNLNFSESHSHDFEHWLTEIEQICAEFRVNAES